MQVLINKIGLHEITFTEAVILINISRHNK